MSIKLDVARWWLRLIEAVAEWWEKRAINAIRRVWRIEKQEEKGDDR